MRLKLQSILSLGISLICLSLPNGAALAQTALPEVQVKPPEPAPAPRKVKPKPRPRTTAASQAGPKVAAAPSVAGAGSATGSSNAAATPSGAAAGSSGGGNGPALVVPTYDKFDTIRATILPTTGANVASMSQAQIQAQPQGDDTPIEKTLLQTPGFSQDSAASGALHLRNDHANVQYRIDGVLLPDGVSGFSQMLDSGFIGNLNVIDGALPAEYGLHTTGIVDVTPRSHAFDGGGSVGLFGGSQGTFSPSFQYGGTVGQTEYYVIARGFQTNEGIENTTSANNAIHDRSDQGKFFGYAKTYLGDGSTVTLMSGISLGSYQIPDNPGQPIQFTVPGANPISSSQVNENQYEQSYYNVLAWQKSFSTVDVQLSAFSRYSSLHFMPDQVGDLEFNGVSSDVFRSSFLNGVQGDTAWRVNSDHTLRFGFTGSGELANADNTSTVFPVNASGNVDGAPFVAPPQLDSKVGWLFGAYAQDEWRITKQLTLNTGLRFDQMYGYVDANQFSPRINLTYKATPSTTFHAGYARYFTPPELALSAPTNVAAFNGTTQQAAVPLDDAVQPERSNVYDVGVDQQLTRWLTAGIDAYYKTATDLIDDGQFGAANTLTAFNYAKGWNEGVETKLNYTRDNLNLYGNLAWGHQYATEPNSNQFLWSDPVEYAYAMTHYIPTDHSQTWTGSAGASYSYGGTLYSVDMIYGSGLRNGFANLTTVPAYTQINLGVSHAFQWSASQKPLTVRFSVVNALDSIYVIRDGTGIGVFAPQYGPRREFFLSLSQAL
jgi:outer membrane receptor protein involved in Fe transport